MLSKIVCLHYQTFILISDTKSDINKKYNEWMKPDAMGRKDIVPKVTDYYAPIAGPSKLEPGPKVLESGDSKVIADIFSFINNVKYLVFLRRSIKFHNSR